MLRFIHLLFLLHFLNSGTIGQATQFASANQTSTYEYDYPYIGRPYTTGIGLRTLGRLGVPGATLRQFITDRQALEAIAGLRTDAFSATLLFEHRIPAFQQYFVNENLNWFLGFGGHATFRRKTQAAIQSDNLNEENNFGFGLDAYFALEYKVPTVPFAFGIDIKPFFELDRNADFSFYPDPGIYARLVLNID